MKLSDYVVEYLSDAGVGHVFTITGGACAHLIDSFHKFDKIKYVCVQHEQAGAMAAEAYARFKGIGSAMATSGPGATNLITGICCAWFDSIPCIYVTGQVNRNESKEWRKVRQVGFQETEIADIVKPITKFSVLVDDPEKIKFYLDKAMHLAKSGRPGPVLVDIPMDVQRAEIEPEKLIGYVPEKAEGDTDDEIRAKVRDSIKLLKEAKRPVLIAGGGIRLANAQNELMKLIRTLNIPVVNTWSGFDLIPYDTKLYVGQIGVYGSRAGNYSIQNSDLMISIGSRLDTRITGGKPETFARAAKKVVSDIDPNEINKKRGLEPDIAVACDAKKFIRILIEEMKSPASVPEWTKRTEDWKRNYPICPPEFRSLKDRVDPYVFVDALSAEMKEGDLLVTDCGANLTWTIQAFKVKKDQRVFSTFGNSPMGYSVPAAIGTAFATGKPVACIIGDGGLQINIQEFQTIAHYKLPVKIFILNNHSYGIIKQFQDLYFGSRYEATVPEKGYTFPDFLRVAEAYGIKTERIHNHTELHKIKGVIESKEAVICDVVIPDDAKIIPRLEFGKPIEDQTPYIDREEFGKNMIVEPYNEKPKGEGV